MRAGRGQGWPGLKLKGLKLEISQHIWVANTVPRREERDSGGWRQREKQRRDGDKKMGSGGRKTKWEVEVLKHESEDKLEMGKHTVRGIFRDEQSTLG